MLKNAILDAKIYENFAKIWQNLDKFCQNFCWGQVADAAPEEREGLRELHADRARADDNHPRRQDLLPRGGAGPTFGHDTSLFRRLVLGWIEADFRIQIRIL